MAGEFTAVRGLRAAAGVDRSMAQKGRAFRQDIKPPHAGKKSLQGAALGGRGGACLQDGSCGCRSGTKGFGGINYKDTFGG